MPRRISRLLFAAAALVTVPVALWWSLLHIAAAIGLLAFSAFLWAATIPLHQDFRAARARLTPRHRRRLMLADDHVDLEFERIVNGEASLEG